MPDDYLMPRAERYQVCPRPATYGAEWSEQTAAQIKRARKEEKQKQAIRAAFPLLAEQLIATEFPKN